MWQHDVLLLDAFRIPLTFNSFIGFITLKWRPVQFNFQLAFHQSSENQRFSYFLFVKLWTVYSQVCNKLLDCIMVSCKEFIKISNAV